MFWESFPKFSVWYWHYDYWKHGCSYFGVRTFLLPLSSSLFSNNLSNDSIILCFQSPPFFHAKAPPVGLWGQEWSYTSTFSYVITPWLYIGINPFSANQLLTTNFSLYNTYKIRHLVMRKWDLIKQSQLLKIKSQILSNLFNEKYGLRLGEFKSTTGTERVKTAIFNNYPQKWSWIVGDHYTEASIPRRIVAAPTGFWPRGRNPWRHNRNPA